MKGEKSISSSISWCTGSTNFIILCTSILVILLSAVIADLGYGEIEYFIFKHNVEEITLAGAKELLYNSKDTENYVKQIALKKVNDLNELEIKISDSNREISVSIGRAHKYNILSLLGIKTRQLNILTTAKISNISTYIGIRPFAIKKQTLEYGKRYVLTNLQTNSKGNIRFTYLNLGSETLEKNIIYGYQKLLCVGDEVVQSTEDSSKVKACSYLEFEEKCPRIIVIPVIKNIDFYESKPMIIDGFATLYIEKCETKNRNIFLSGRFIRYVVKDSVTDGIDDFGLYGIDLLNRK